MRHGKQTQPGAGGKSQSEKTSKKISCFGGIRDVNELAGEIPVYSLAPRVVSREFPSHGELLPHSVHTHPLQVNELKKELEAQTKIQKKGEKEKEFAMKLMAPENLR